MHYEPGFAAAPAVLDALHIREAGRARQERFLAAALLNAAAAELAREVQNGANEGLILNPTLRISIASEH